MDWSGSVARWVRRAAAGGVTTLALAGCAPHTAAASVDDHATRAATIVRMLRFVQWGQESDRIDALRIAVVDNAALGAALRAVSAGMPSPGRTLTVVDVTSTRALGDVRASVVIVGALSNADTATLVRTLSHRAVLTVGDGDCPDETRLMLNLFADGDGYRFQANPAAAARAGVSLSARLLQLAHIVN